MYLSIDQENIQQKLSRIDGASAHRQEALRKTALNIHPAWTPAWADVSATDPNPSDQDGSGCISYDAWEEKLVTATIYTYIYETIVTSCRLLEGQKMERLLSTGFSQLQPPPVTSYICLQDWGVLAMGVE